MDREFINFLKDAYNGGLCEEYKNEIRKCHEDKLSLVRLAMRQQSIPYIATKMHEGIITKEYVQNAFSGFLNGFILNDCDCVDGYTYTWYMEYAYDNDIILDADVTHISFTKDANVVVPQTKCPTIYISNGSVVHLICEGYNSVNVKIFDESEIIIDDMDESSNVFVYRYSDESSVEEGKFCLNGVKVFNKKLIL